MRFQKLLPTLLLAPTTLAAPIPNPQDIALLGLCLTGPKHCTNGPGLFTSLFGANSASNAAAGGRGSTPTTGGIMTRSEQASQFDIGGLLSSLPLVSSLLGSGGGAASGGGLGLKERRGEEAGITDLLSGLPLLGSLLGGGRPKSPMGPGMMGMGRGQPGPSIGI